MPDLPQRTLLGMIAVFFLGFCRPALAGKGALAAGREVDVYVVDHASVSPAMYYRATFQASELLARVGVRVTWKNGSPPREVGCRPVIALTIEEAAPTYLKPDVPALTHLDDGSISVFYSRIRPALRTSPNLAPALLAQVFAHEICHSLQGISRHSESGTMKAHWSVVDYRAMLERQLGFSAMDAALIRGLEVLEPLRGLAECEG